MKTVILYMIVFFSSFTSCNSQEVKNKNKDEKKKPHEEVTVNRKYDKDGNLIEFDSTYTSYYSNLEGDTLDLKSALNDFPSFFNEEFFNLHSKNMFDPFFSQDSALNPHFFHDDFFEQQFISQNKEMLKMIQEMDSIKNTFFERQGKKK